MEEKRVNRNYAAMMAVIVLSVLFIIVGAILAIDPAFPVAVLPFVDVAYMLSEICLNCAFAYSAA